MSGRDKIWCKVSDRLCIHPKENYCSAEYDHLYCTRKKGHSGMHVACSVDEHNLMAWYDSKHEPEPEMAKKQNEYRRIVL